MIRWKERSVVSVPLRDGSHALGQMLKSPFFVFFDIFSGSGEWTRSSAKTSVPLFFCSVTRQFLSFSHLVREHSVQPRDFAEFPTLWIDPFDGSRKIIVYKGTSRQREVLLLSSRPGGRLIEKHIDASGFHDWPVILDTIPLDDNATIDSYELNVIWTYPALNERLLLCKLLGRSVDPLKDLTFDRPIPEEYATFVDILSGRGGANVWG